MLAKSSAGEYTAFMSKHTAMVFLGILVALLPVLGFPPSVRDVLIFVSGITIAVLAYLSSVVYCSNCKKLIEEADQVLEQDGPEEKRPSLSDIKRS